MNRMPYIIIYILILCIWESCIYAYSTSAEQPKLIIQNGHSDGPSSIKFSPNGTYIASGGDDSYVKLWLSSSGELLRTYKGHNGSVTSVAFSPDSKYIASGSHDSTVKIWSVLSEEPIRTLTGKQGNHKWVEEVVFSPDGKLLASCQRYGTINLWSVSTGILTKTIQTDGDVFSISFSPDSQYIVSGNEDHTIKVFSTNTGELYKTINAHNGIVTNVAFSPDGKYIASDSTDKTIKVWTFVTGDLVNTFDGFTSFSFSPDGCCIVAGSYDDNPIHIFTLQTGKIIWKFNNIESKGDLVSYSKDGKYIIYRRPNDGSIIKLDIHSGNILFAIKSGQIPAESSALSLDGATLAIGSRNDSIIKLWDMKSGNLKKIIEGVSIGMTTEDIPYSVNAIAFSPDGNTLAAGFDCPDCNTVQDIIIQLLDLKTGRLIQRFDEQGSAMNSLAFSPNGKLFAYGGIQNIKIRSVETGELIYAFYDQDKQDSTFTYDVECVAFSPDGRLIVATFRDKIKIWDTTNGNVIQTIYPPTNRIRAIAFDPNGSSIATGGEDNIVYIWSISTGKLINKYVGHSSFITTLAYSPQGKYIASGSNDKTVKVWSIITGDLIHIFQGYEKWIQDLAFSPDGNVIITLSSGVDSMVKIWNVETGNELSSLIIFNDGAWFVFSPQGFFDCSNNAMEYIRWRTGNTLYKPDQFFDEFYRPNLLAVVIAGKEIPDKKNISAGFMPPPILEILEPKTGDIFETERIKVIVKATDTGGGVENIQLYHNGKRLDGAKTVTAEPIINKGEHIRTFNVQLITGENTLQASAYSSDNTESVRKEVKIVLMTTDEHDAELFLLSVGISEYYDSALNLRFAASDADAFAGLMESSSKNIFKQIHQIKLRDNIATKENILAAMKEIKDKANPWDVVILFMSGHGMTLANEENEKSNYYFIPYEMIYNSDDDIVQNALSQDYLKEFLTGVQALKTLMVLDTCSSGGMVLAMKGMAEKRALALLAKSSGSHLITASSDSQYAMETAQLKHGILTHALLEGLEGNADAPPADGIVSVMELLPYIQKVVPDYAEEHFNKRQFPQIYSTGMDFPLVMGHGK